MADTSHLIADYGDRALIAIVIGCWRARAVVIRKSDERDSSRMATRYEQGAASLEAVLKYVHS